MATFVWKNAYVSVDGTDLSDHVISVNLTYGAEILDDTKMNDNGVKEKLAGFKDWSVEVEFAQDFASGSVDATLNSLVGADAFTIAVRPTTSAASATNPEYTGSALLESYNPISGSVNERATTTATFQGSGVLTRSTS